jgi:hypothetical protein
MLSRMVNQGQAHERRRAGGGAMTPKREPPRRRPVVEEIEPRILYSADLLPTVDGPDAGVLPAEQRVVAGDGEFAAGQFSDVSQSAPREIVFVDASVPDAASLTDALRAQRADASGLEVVTLDGERDGISQISALLAERENVAAIHLISHGADGRVMLGTSVLDAGTLAARATEITGWGQALTWDADMLLYGCDVAQTEEGRALVDGLACITGADVAASDDPTGAGELGGDRALEYLNGAVEAPVLLEPRGHWLGRLDAEPDGASVGQISVAATPLAFERNAGQSDATVDFIARGSGYGVWLTQADAVIALDNADGGHVVRLGLIDANTAPTGSGEALLSQRSNYLVGSEDQWLREVESYGAVRYDQVYAGVDLRYYGNAHQLEYDFIVQAGADAGQIRIAFEGTLALSIDADGNLVLTLDEAGRTLSFRAPIAYQDGADGREAVASRYVLHEDGSVGFELGDYDASRRLVIDPILAYGTYLGGSGGEQIWSMDTDAAGNVYVTGYTTSTNLPVTAGAYSSYVGSKDVFVSKFSPDLSTLFYSTYLGGSGNEEGYGIAVDSVGNAIVTGYTDSTDLPLVAAYQGTRQGVQDAFVAKLNATGSGLVYSTLLGGTGGGDIGYAVAVDGTGAAYVTGYTDSSDFATTAGALDATFGGAYEAFVVKLGATGTLAYSTFLGGSNWDQAYNIEVDPGGNAVVVGATWSTGFSTALPGAFQPGNGSTGNKADAFVAKLNGDGTALLYGTFLGGSSNDYAYGVAIDGSGRIYVSGDTTSSDFDVTTGAMQATRPGGNDGFVAVIDPALSGTA